MKKTLSLLFLFLTGAGLAQVDSLKECLSDATGKEKIRILNTLTVIDTTSSYRNYHNEAMALARKMKDVPEEIKVWCAMGDHYSGNGQEDSALSYYSKGLAVARAHKLQKEVVFCLDRKAMTAEDYQHYDQASAFYNEALAESRKMSDKKEIGHALEQLGSFHQYLRNDSLAIKYMTEHLGITKEIKDSVQMFVCLNNIGTVYLKRREYENAILYFKNSLLIQKKLHKDTAVAESQLNIGIIYKDQGNYVTALKYLLDALTYLKNLKPSISQGSCYNSLGTVYMELKEYEKAIFFHCLSLSVRQKIGYKRGIAISYNNIAETYAAQGKYDLAFTFINQAIKLKEDLGDKGSLAVSIDMLGEIYFLKNDFIQAEKYFLKALELRQDVKDPKEKATTLNKLGALYLQWGKYDLARKKLDEAREIAEATGVKKILLENYEITIRLLKATGNTEELPHFYEELIALNENILNAEKNKALTEMQVKYKTEEKDQEIALMNEKEKANAATVSQQNTVIYALLAGALLLIVITFLSIKAFRSGVKANKQSKIIIEQKQTMIEQKQTMMKELHHRVKNNLQLLASLLKLQHKRLEDPSTKEAIKAVEHRLNAMLLIHQDLYGDSADSSVDMNVYVKKMTDNLLFSYGNPGVQVNLNLLTEQLAVDAGKALNIGFIFNEVINNAFKHAFSATAFPALDITFGKNEKEQLVFTITDNGKGMPAENKPGEAASFGLGLIHMLVKEMEGSITITSDNKGSRFKFIIPINNSSK
jgi:two-component sensor histidine kinase/Flp pilus assembly protein TadD